MYCTVFVTVFVTTAKVYGMNSILLRKTKKQYATKIFTIKIQNLNIKSGVFF